MKTESSYFEKKYKNALFAINNLLQRRRWLALFLLFVVIVLLVFFIPKYLNLVAFLGKRILQENIRFDYIKGLLWAIFLGITIFIWPVRSQDKKTLMWIWVVKCFVMLFLMLFYEYHYETDAFGYFHQAGLKLISWKALFLEDQIRPNFPVTIITKLHYCSLLNSFHATKVTFGMIGLVAIYIFYRSVVLFLREEKILLLYIFAFFPSILFWSSIIGKDPVVLFGVAVYCYGAIKWIRTGLLSSSIAMCLGITIGAFIRPWLGLILGIPIFIITFKPVIMENFVKKIAVLFLLLATISFFNHKVMLTFGFKSFNELNRIANQKFIGFNRGGSMTEVKLPVAQPGKVNLPGNGGNAEGDSGSMTEVKLPVAQPEKVNLPGNGGNAEGGNGISQTRYKSFKDMILFLPRGIFTVLFRPLPGEVRNTFGLLAGLEGVFLLVLFAFAIKALRWKKLLDPVVIWAILLVGTWASLYAFISYNLGTVCRYRLQILPVFLGLLLYLVYTGDKEAVLKNKGRRQK